MTGTCSDNAMRWTFEEFCGSMMFQIFLEQCGTVEQKRKLRMLLSEIVLQL